MLSKITKSISPQSEQIYRLLLKNHSLTAKAIAKNLNIFPHAVYRAAKPLIEFGFIHKVGEYPIKYEAKPISETVDLYAFLIMKSFREAFYSGQKEIFNKPLDIQFIKDREDLIEKTNRDLENSKITVDFIISGLEVSPETVLQYKNALQRGVKIKAIVQNLDETTKEMFDNWQRMGVVVRYHPNMEARIFIIDEKIVYFTSYNPQNKDEAIGARFNYSPLARLINELFEKRWKIAEKISKG